MKPDSTPIREYEQAVYVYWLGPNLPTVKIGHTNAPDRRLAEFQRETGTPGHKARFAAIVWLDRRREAVEREAHRILAYARRNGEWFACTPAEALGAIVQAVTSLNIRYEIEDCAGITPEFHYNARRQDVLARRQTHRVNLLARIAEAQRVKHEADRSLWIDMTCQCSVFIAGGNHPDPSSSEAITYMFKKRFGDNFKDAWVDQVNAAMGARKLRQGNEGKLFLLAHPTPDARYYAMHDAGNTPVEAAIEVIEQCERAEAAATASAAATAAAERTKQSRAQRRRDSTLLWKVVFFLLCIILIFITIIR